MAVRLLPVAFPAARAVVVVVVMKPVPTISAMLTVPVSACVAVVVAVVLVPLRTLAPRS